MTIVDMIISVLEKEQAIPMSEIIERVFLKHGVTLKKNNVYGQLVRLYNSSEINKIEGFTRYQLSGSARSLRPKSHISHVSMILGCLEKDRSISSNELVDRIKEKYGVDIKKQQVQTALSYLWFVKKVDKNYGATEIKLAPTE